MLLFESLDVCNHRSSSTKTYYSSITFLVYRVYVPFCRGSTKKSPTRLEKRKDSIEVLAATSHIYHSYFVWASVAICTDICARLKNILNIYFIYDHSKSNSELMPLIKRIFLYFKVTSISVLSENYE